MPFSAIQTLFDEITFVEIVLELFVILLFSLWSLALDVYAIFKKLQFAFEI